MRKLPGDTGPVLDLVVFIVTAFGRVGWSKA